MSIIIVFYNLTTGIVFATHERQKIVSSVHFEVTFQRDSHSYLCCSVSDKLPHGQDNFQVTSIPITSLD